MSTTSAPLSHSDATVPLTLAEQLKAAREGLSLSQRQLAKECGISQKQIFHAEAGYEITLSTVQKIVDGLARAGSKTAFQVHPNMPLSISKPW